MSENKEEGNHVEEPTPSSISVPDKSDDDNSIESSDLSNFPPEARQLFAAHLSSSSTTLSRVSTTSALIDKMTDEHISKYIEYMQRDDDNAFELQKTNRWFYLTYVIIGVVVLGMGVVYLLPRDREMFNSLVQIIVLVAGGLGAGFGIAQVRQ